LHCAGASSPGEIFTAPFATSNTVGENARDHLAFSCPPRCTMCGHKGATLQHPAWAGTNAGFVSFLIEKTRGDAGRLMGAGQTCVCGDCLQDQRERA
jgi:hypothetical protein